MEDTFTTPMSGQLYKDYSKTNPDVNFMKDDEKGSFLNKILRGEISAIEAYEQVIPTFQNKSDRDRLTAIRDEHDRIVERLKMLVEHTRFAPEEASGPWGTVVTTIVGAAKLVSNTISLVTLMEGEEHGLRLYNDALSLNLSFDERDVIAIEIMPLLKKHIATLEHMVKHQDDHVVDKE